MTRYVVTVTRTEFIGLAVAVDVVVLGPFRTEARADARAATVRRLAETYEDPEGVTGPENMLSVDVEPLEPGRLSAVGALQRLYELA